MNAWKGTVNGLSLLLTGILLVVAGLLVWQWQHPPAVGDFTRVTAEKVDPGETSSTITFAPVPLNAYREITERPLFVEGRMPPKPEENAPASAAPRALPLKLKLEGVVITPQNRVAVIRDLSSNRLLRVTEGMNQDDRKLVQVDNASATVERGGERLTLELEIPGAGKQRFTPPKQLPFGPR
ncbi:MAG: type II secretion system protein N [Candidatus Thiodiazotropha sp.]